MERTWSTYARSAGHLWERPRRRADLEAGRNSTAHLATHRSRDQSRRIDRLHVWSGGVRRSGESTSILARYIAFWNRVRGGRWEIIAYVETGVGSPVANSSSASGTDVPPTNLTGRAARAAAEIAAADSDFADEAALSGTATAFANAVASDGVIFGGPEILVGPAAIKAFFDAQHGVSISWHPVYAFASESGDLGFSIGESVTTLRGQSGAAVQHFGKYLTVWRKSPNGTWKLSSTVATPGQVPSANSRSSSTARDSLRVAHR